ncbi:MAG: hypothetical protein ABI968_09795 [Acidobacteriota bacterium]
MFPFLLAALLLQAAEPRTVLTADGWTNRGFVGELVSIVATDPHDPETVYAGNHRGLFRSVDGGLHWIDLLLPIGDVYLVRIAPSDSSVLYAAGTRRISLIPDDLANDLFRSTDAGATWTQIDEAGWPFGYAVAVDPTDALTIFVNASPPGMSRSADGGSTWTSLPLAPEANHITIDPRASATLYAVGSYADGRSGVFKSTDAGATWTPTGLALSFLWFLEVDPTDSETLYAGSQEFYTSHDGGATWGSSAGFPPSDLPAFAVAPDQPRALYTGTGGDGVFMSADDGATWSPLGPLRGETLSLAVAQTPAGRILYAGTPDGVWRLALRSTRSLAPR